MTAIAAYEIRFRRMFRLKPVSPFFWVALPLVRGNGSVYYSHRMVNREGYPWDEYCRDHNAWMGVAKLRRDRITRAYRAINDILRPFGWCRRSNGVWDRRPK